WENNSRENRFVWAKRCPTSQVTCCLRADALSRVCGWSREGRCCPTRRARGCSAGRRSVDNRVDVPIQGVVNKVEGVVRHIPARVRERVIERALIRDAKPAAECRLSITKYVVGKTESRSEVIVVTRP